MLWLMILVPGLAAAMVTMLSTPLVIHLAHRVGAVDIPGGRKRHRRTTPRLGGVAIVGGIVVVLGPALVLFTSRSLEDFPIRDLLGFTFAAGLVFCLGLLDDIYRVRALYKLGVQTVAASVVVAMGWQFSTVRLPVEGAFQLGILAPVLSVVWIVGVTNAINFVDGMDGLAAGLVAIIGGSLLVLAVLQRSPETVVTMSCIVGASLGFLRHNWSPAKIYMGDSGSLMLGFLLATISLRSSPSVKASAALAILVPVLALGLPVFDTLLVIWYRFLRGHRTMDRIARVFHADRAHLHYLLVDGTAKRRRAMVILFGITAVFCGMALWVAASDSWGMGVAFLVVEFLVVVLVRRAGLAAEARRVASRKIDHISGSGARSGSVGTPEGALSESEPTRRRAGSGVPE